MRSLIMKLSKFANRLDNDGKYEEANLIDQAIRIIANKDKTKEQSVVQPQVNAGPIQYPNATFLKEEIFPGRSNKAAWYEQATPEGKQLIVIETDSSGSYPTRQSGPEGSIFVYQPNTSVTYGKPGWTKIPPSNQVPGYSQITLISQP